MIDENEEQVKQRLTAFIRQIAGWSNNSYALASLGSNSNLPVTSHNPQDTADHLKVFAKMNEQRLYKLLKTCMDPQTDLKGLVKSMV